jgi:hypothetical protein
MPAESVAEMSNSFPVCHRPLELQRNLPEANGCPRKEKSKSDFNVRMASCVRNLTAGLASGAKPAITSPYWQ